MPIAIINDVEMHAKVGENLLGVARRNAAHIGFVCDGNGVCQTCQCRVLSGADQLSPPSEAELAWMPDRRLAAGHRLACQSVIRGHGRVRVLTNVEELRRQTLDVLRPARDVDRRDALEPLLENLVRMSADQLIRYPWNLMAALLRVKPWRFAYPVLDAQRYSDDAARVARRMQSGAARLARPSHSIYADTSLALADAATDAAASVAAIAPPHTLVEERIVDAARALRRARNDVRRYS